MASAPLQSKQSAQIQPTPDFLLLKWGALRIN